MSVQLVSPAHHCRSTMRVGLLRTQGASALSLAVDRLVRTALSDARLKIVRVPTTASTATVRRSVHELTVCDVLIAQLDWARDPVSVVGRVAEVVHVLPTPAIVVLHSIPSHPRPGITAALIGICESASMVVVMSEAAKRVLVRTYPVDGDKVVVIPWSASSARPLPLGRLTDREGRHHIVTWGDICPGLGAEHVVDAVSELNARGHAVRYTVASTERTEPAYACRLRRRAESGGVGHLVRISAGTRDFAGLRRLAASASLVVLPFDDDAAVSPSLVEAIAAGRPVIATAFAHASDLLRDGAGLLVPHRNPVAMAEAIRVATTDRCVLEAMTRRARLLAPSLNWELSTRRLARLLDRVAAHDQMLAA